MTSIKGLRATALVAMAVLVGCAGTPQQASTPVEPAAPRAAPAAAERVIPPTLRIVGVGDIMMGTNFPEPVYLNPDLDEDAYLPAIVGWDLLDILRGGDVTFGNLEGTLFDGPDDAEHKPCRSPKSCYVFRSPEFHAALLRDMGFNAMSLANNHAGDFREAGQAATMAALARNDIVYAGVDNPGARTGTLTLENGIRVGLAAFAPNWGTVYLNDHARAQQIVRQLDAFHDVVLVSFHGGGEGAEMTRVPREMEIFRGEERGDVWRFAHDVIDAGADVVLGHGPHVPRAVEIYRGRFIAYSLGNFWTYGRFNLKDLAGIAPVVDLVLSSADGRLVEARIHSIRQVGWGVPRVDPSGAALNAVAELTARDFPEAALEFAADGRIIPAPAPLASCAGCAPPYRAADIVSQ
ncbi:MAG: CapA family protein [Rhodospirillales bacterium]|nr:MAG: CapA family protein [Rhodospirillales bacterium]